MKVLLVEPNYYTTFIPLGLAKISTYHKENGDEVRYIKGQQWFTSGYNPDIIYITTLFTYELEEVLNTIESYKHTFPEADIKVGGVLASLMPDRIEEATGIKPHIGLLPDVENCVPDYTLFPDVDYSVGFTTRGCPNRCKYCMVHKHEPDFIEIENWWNMINPRKKMIYLWDNNFLAASEEHRVSVLNRLAGIKRYGCSVDFNQGLDCRFFDRWMASKFSKVRMYPLRFAFDKMSQEEPLRKAVELATHYGIRSQNIYIYCLFNYKDDLEEALYRARVIWKELNCLPFPMLYRPLDWTSKEIYISKKWTYPELMKFRNFWTVKEFFKSMEYEDYDPKKHKSADINTDSFCQLKLYSDGGCLNYG